MSKVQLYNWLIATIGNEPCTLLCFFEDTLSEVNQLLKAAGSNAATARLAGAANAPGNQFPVYVVELLPLKTRFANVVSQLRQSEAGSVHLLTHLDDPFFIHFGGDRIKILVEKLGMAAEESISHAMITTSIQNAQEKIESKLHHEKQASNMTDWLHLNLAN